MITLYQFAPVWGIPNLGVFCSKIETGLRIAGLNYETKSTLPVTAPKGKLPYVDDDGKCVGDSRFIVEHLKDHYSLDLDEGLSLQQRAISNAFQRLIEDDLYWVMMYSRWSQPHNWPINKKAIFGNLPFGVRGLVATMVRRQIRKQIWGQGMGRHSENEIFQLGKQDLTSLSDFLADKPYFMGDKPTMLDASAFGFLSNVLWCPCQSQLKEHLKSCENLVQFCERMNARFFKNQGENQQAATA